METASTRRSSHGSPGRSPASSELPDGAVIEPTGKSFDVMFSTIARWQDGKILAEYLKYDNASFLQQVGLA